MDDAALAVASERERGAAEARRVTRAYCGRMLWSCPPVMSE